MADLLLSFWIHCHTSLRSQIAALRVRHWLEGQLRNDSWIDKAVRDKIKAHSPKDHKRLTSQLYPLIPSKIGFFSFPAWRAIWSHPSVSTTLLFVFQVLRLILCVPPFKVQINVQFFPLSVPYCRTRWAASSSSYEWEKPLHPRLNSRISMIFNFGCGEINSCSGASRSGKDEPYEFVMNN